MLPAWSDWAPGGDTEGVAFPELAQATEVKEAVLAGAEPGCGAGEDGDLHDVAVGDRFDERVGTAESVVIGDAGQAGQSVGGPEGEAEVEPDLVAVVEAEMGDNVVPAAGQGEDDKGDVEEQEGLVESDAEREEGKAGR